MKRVLFFIESLGGGGAENVLSTLVTHIDKSKFEVTVCTICDGGKYADGIRKAVNLTSLLPAYSNLSAVGRFWYRIKYHLIYSWLPKSIVYHLWIPKGNDVEVAFVEGYATKLLAHSSNKKAKHIAWVHIDLNKYHWTKICYKNKEEEAACYNHYDNIVCVSKVVEEAMHIKFDVKSSTCTLYNPIDANNILEKSTEQIPDSKNSQVIRFVSVGRLSAQKAYDRLLRIACRLINDGFLLELWILGTGSEKTKLCNYIEKKGLSQYIRLLGFQDNPYKYVSKCDVFVCSSISEGYSTAITEALILGLPVVSTDVSGAQEQLINGCGIIVKNDEESLYQGMKNVIERPVMLKEMKNKAIERGKEFQLEKLMTKIEEILL